MYIFTEYQIKVCECVLPKKQQIALWDIIWNEQISKEILNQTNGRCYFITCNNEIYKVGFSDSGDGIKGTINAYRNCGNSGSPSDRTHGIHILIAEELLKNNKIEFWFYYQEKANAKILRMNGEFVEQDFSISGKELEKINLKYIEEIDGKKPEWNFQESSKKWPNHIIESNKALKGEHKIKVTLEDVKKRLKKEGII